MVYQVLCNTAEDCGVGEIQLLSPRRKGNDLMERLNSENMRHPNSRSPRPEHPPHSQNRKIAYRRPDPGTEEFMRFIREYQFEKQPTHIRLQKKVPLPGIGESLSLNVSSNYDRANANSQYEDSLVDNEVALLNNKMDPRRDPMLQEVLTLARERTKDHIILNSISNGQLGADVNRNNTLTRQPNNFGSKSNKTSKTQNGLKSNIKGHSKQLPPISREEIPERPSAPSPSVTPPFPNNSDDSFSMEEPVDYIEL